MCATNEVQRSATAAAATDDVWDSDSDSEQHQPAQQGQLDREWEARKQQFYNAGYREGVEEGKEVTLQQGFNAGFSEGARAGYEFGLVKGALQLLASHLDEASDSKHAKVQELHQQVSALSNRTVMQDTCTALLAQDPDDVISTHLQAALTLSGGDAEAEGCRERGTSGAEAGSSTANPAAMGAASADPAATPSSSSSNVGDAAAELPLPLQLVAHLKQELHQLGFDVGAAPPLTVSDASTAAAAAVEETSTT